VDGEWQRTPDRLSLIPVRSKWNDHRQEDLRQLTKDIIRALPQTVAPESRKQFFEDSLLPAEAMRLTREVRSQINQSYQSPFSFWHTDILAQVDPERLAQATSDWETLVFSTTPTTAEHQFPLASFDRIMTDARAFTEWVTGWQDRVPNRQSLVALNLERFVEATPVTKALRHSLECRPGLIVSTVALYDAAGKLVHEDSRLLPILPDQQPAAEFSGNFAPCSIELAPADAARIKALSNVRWTPNQAKELMSQIADPNSMVWTWRRLIGQGLTEMFPDRPVVAWLPDSEVSLLSKYVAGDHLAVDQYLKARLVAADGLTLTQSPEGVIVRPRSLPTALRQTLPRRALQSFATEATQANQFLLASELSLARNGDGYLYSPYLRLLRRLAASAEFVWPYAPAEERAIWAVSQILGDDTSPSRFPMTLSNAPPIAKKALYHLRGRAGSSIIFPAEATPLWLSSITSRWATGIPASASFALVERRTPVIRQRVHQAPWSLPNEPSSLGFTEPQLADRSFWPGYRLDRDFVVSDGAGGQIVFPVIDGFSFELGEAGVGFDDLPSSHRPVLIKK